MFTKGEHGKPCFLSKCITGIVQFIITAAGHSQCEQKYRDQVSEKGSANMNELSPIVTNEAKQQRLSDYQEWISNTPQSDRWAFGACWLLWPREQLFQLSKTRLRIGERDLMKGEREAVKNFCPPGKATYLHRGQFKREMCVYLSVLAMLQVPGGSLGSEGGVDIFLHTGELLTRKAL